MSKWRSASAIEALKKTVEYTHIRRANAVDGKRELFGTIASIPWTEKGEACYAVGLSTRRTERMPSKKIGREAALGRALRTCAESMGFIGRSADVDHSGAYSIVRGFMTAAQFELFQHLCEQAPDQAVVHFNTALLAPMLLEAA
jgi:hypothetical protein